VVHVTENSTHRATFRRAQRILANRNRKRKLPPYSSTAVAVAADYATTMPAARVHGPHRCAHTSRGMPKSARVGCAATLSPDMWAGRVIDRGAGIFWLAIDACPPSPSKRVTHASRPTSILLHPRPPNRRARASAVGGHRQDWHAAAAGAVAIVATHVFVPFAPPASRDIHSSSTARTGSGG